MATAEQYYGKHFNSEQCSLERLDGDGQRTSCVGLYPSEDYRNWYGYVQPNGNRLHPQHLSFCEHCARIGFTDEEVYQITEEDFPDISWVNINCDSFKTEDCLKYGIDRRCLNYNGLRLNLNHVDPTDDNDFRPVLSVPSMEEGKKQGVVCYSLPRDAYWELGLKGDPNGRYKNSNNYYFTIEMKDQTGKVIHIRDQNGFKGFKIPITRLSPQRINAYDSGYDKRFMFVAPSVEEVNAGVTDILAMNQSNIFEVSITVYERIKYIPPRPVMDTSALRCGGATRGCGGATRGLTRSYSGGANVSAQGYSAATKTQTTNDSFNLLDKVYMTVQLVCNQSREERLRLGREIEMKGLESKKKELEELERRKKELMQPSERANIFGISHEDQKKIIMKGDDLED